MDVKHHYRWDETIKNAVDEYFTSFKPPYNHPGYMYYRRWSKGELGIVGMLTVLEDFANKKVKMIVE